jgi:hypothetical protein
MTKLELIEHLHSITENATIFFMLSPNKRALVEEENITHSDFPFQTPNNSEGRITFKLYDCDILEKVSAPKLIEVK